MAKIGNKVINYTIKAKIDGVTKSLGDTTNVQLPSFEMLTDTIKGSGIMGEIDYPTLAQLGSQTATIGFRNTTKEQMLLFSPKAQDIQISYVVDKYDSGANMTKIEAHKVYIKGIPKKAELGKIEPNTSQEASSEFEVLYYQHIIDGVSMIEIDKINNVFKVESMDYAAQIRKSL